MPTKFAMIRDIDGFNSFGLNFAPDSTYDTTLAAGVAQTVTVPSTANSYAAVFQYEPGASVWVAQNQTSTLPGAAFATTFAQLNPTTRKVNSGDTLSFISNNTTAEVAVSFYELITG